MPTKSPPATATSAPKTCTGDPWDFVATNCQLTWAGITIYGTIDAGVAYQTHGTPYDPRSAVGASYLIQKQNRSPTWSVAPNGLSNSTIGIKGTEPIGGDFSAVFALDTGYDPYSWRASRFDLCQTTASEKRCDTCDRRGLPRATRGGDNGHFGFGSSPRAFARPAP
jgi:hypothetical protein